MENLLRKFKYLIILILAILIFTISFINYQNTKEVIKEKYNSRQLLVEKNILQTIRYINDSYKIAEKYLNEEMREYSNIMQKKYRDDPQVMNWDLEELQKKFVDYDIYIIDDGLKIIRTTREEDLGLDFSRYGSFSTVLRERLNGDDFVVDRLELATQTGRIRKYSYMPTDDNQYLLELSIDIQEKFPSLKGLNIFKDAGWLTAEYDIVKDISFFSVEPINHNVAELRSDKKPYLKADVSEIAENLVSQTVIKNEIQVKEVKTEEDDYTYKFFPAFIVDKNEQEKGWNSYVVGIVYNNGVMAKEINDHTELFSLNLILMAIVFISFIAIVIYFLNKFEYQAYHDQLTALANRDLFEKEFKRLKKKADSENKFGILFLDIDKFKEINDNFGHDIGDRVLEIIAKRLKSNLKRKDCLARIGGDEFVILITDIRSKTQLLKIAERIMNESKKVMIIDEKEFTIGLSGGISIYPEDGRELDELIKNADKAMYRAKRKQSDLEFNNNEE